MKRQLLLTLAIVMCCGLTFAQPRSASEPKLLVKADVSLMAPVWSPNGDKIAVTSTAYTGVFVANADGSDLKCVTDAAGAGYKMQWSTDSKQILGRTNIVENNRVLHEVKVWSVNNSSARTLIHKTRDLKGTPTWKSIDRVIISDRAGVRTLSLNGNPTATVANAYDIMMNDPVGAMTKIASLKDLGGRLVLNPSLSPDGKKVAFQVYGKGM